MPAASAEGSVEQMSAATDAFPAPRRFDWRTPVRWFGLLCLMGAAFFGGYVVWLLYGTGLETQRAQNDLRPGIERQIEHPTPASQAPGPGHRVIPGSAYAIIQIPSIDLDMVVVQGTDYTSLKKGPGHYIDTADPWNDTGRVGIAGHRTTYLHPFFDLDEVGPTDTIRLLTPYGTFTYRVTRVFVIPEEGSGVVLDQTTNPTLVLTTCNPKYASSQRLIVEAERIARPPT
jgi:LPXTG-site transpeptidase (sortase) family protein